MSARSTFSTPCMHSSPTASISYPKNMFCRCLVCCSFVVQYWLTRPSPSVSPAGFRGSSSQRPRPFLLSLPAATGGGGRRGGPAYPYTHSCIPPGPPRQPTAKRASEAARRVEERLRGSRRIRCGRARSPSCRRRLRSTPCGATAAGAPGNACRPRRSAGRPGCGGGVPSACCIVQVLPCVGLSAAVAPRRPPLSAPKSEPLMVARRRRAPCAAALLPMPVQPCQPKPK